MKRSFLIAGIAFLALALIGSATPAQAQSQKPGWLGVSIQDVSKDLMKDENLKNQDGAYVADVVDESPADSAGIKKGDVIVEFAGRTIYDSDDLSKAVSRTKPGTNATVVLIRKGEKKNLAVVIQKQPRRRGVASFFGLAPRVAVFSPAGRMLGLQLMELNEQLAEYFGAPNNEGVLVQGVKKESSGEKAGFKAGDVLLKIGSREIDEMSDVTRALDKYEEGDKVEVEVLRKGAKKTLSVEVEEEEGPWGFSMPGGHYRFFGEPSARTFEFDTDRFDNEYRYELEPKLRELEFKLKSMPKIDINRRDLEQKLRQSLRSVERLRSL